MIRIAKWLFLIHALIIFYYILSFSFVYYSGNGGEYWGFSGFEDPIFEAIDSYNVGDYRLLAFDIEDSYGRRARYIPDLVHCLNIDPSITSVARLNHVSALHGPDSIRLAARFSRRYNEQMYIMVFSEFGYRCEIYDEE